ncbi:hypothetical protein NDU88_000553 [Pleurodeles waltl]|uniref:Uncharacterized protein n=1 Tax=Pleurodeles waltl TaxID=8319 RepID=A0AAV7LAH5_PLEWA|nr:hypothetical protein NDU88_000553 [Pleurodeles waltl]
MMKQYTTTSPFPQRQTRLGGPGQALEEPATAGEPMHAELLAATFGTRVALEWKIEAVAGGSLEMAGHVGQGWPGPSGQYGVGLARTSGVDGMDCRRRGEGPSRVSPQRCVDSDSVSRIEIQQDGTMAVVDPEQAVVLAGPSDMEDGVLSVDS